MQVREASSVFVSLCVCVCVCVQMDMHVVWTYSTCFAFLGIFLQIGKVWFSGV